ncbi:Isochorismatase-like protein [Cladochytrium replicatum]|nr:Isochorismatase-like protein [Cladochytrium replicatum]
MATLGINRSTTTFFLCDIQERFRSAIFPFSMTTSLTPQRRWCTAAASILNIPIIVTEQNPKALGATVSELNVAQAALVVPKTKFSMLTPEVEAKVKEIGAKSVVIFGIESHVCVTQTTLELLEKGYSVVVLADGVSSAEKFLLRLMYRLRHAGAIVTTSESLLFQLLVDAADPQFKQISNLIKETNATMQAALDDLVLGASKI